MSNSCFKIIACGGRDFVDDDLPESSSESKGGSEKRGWSFRKRSARHRVLSHTVVISETLPAGSKDSHDSAAVDLQRQPMPIVPHKTSPVEAEEISQLPLPVNSRFSEGIAAEPADTKVDVNPNESAVTIIQAAIRGFLAQKVLLKHKNIAKLQAAVRGHLVRRHAVGTLRCVQAIVKMQALVRARHARILEEGYAATEKSNEEHGNDYIPMLMGKVKSGGKPPVSYTSVEKLLSSRFACQLLESTPRTKSINIKCDPLKSDSAWKWLERWMSVSSTENKLSPDIKQQEEKKIEEVDSQDRTVIISESNCKSVDLNPSKKEFENKENLSTHDAERCNVQAWRAAAPSLIHNLKQSEPHNIYEINSEKMASDSLPSQGKVSDFPSEVEPTVPGVPNTKEVQSGKRAAPQQREPEGKRFSFGSRKASNPAFLAANSKFEELSACTNSSKSLSSTNQDIEAKSHTDMISSLTDHISKKQESGLGENLVLNNSKVHFVGSDASRVQFGGSECGTEFSISSTLDSPDRSECGANRFEQEDKSIENRNGYPGNQEHVEVEANGESSLTDSDLHDSDAVQVCKSIAEASPRNHATVPEPCRRTPSSEVLVKPRRVKGDKHASIHKLRSSSTGKQSPSNMDRDSGGRSSIEQLPKDNKTGKQRNSFGSPRPDHVDQGPRDSSSNNSLPSYMQPTESARAKALLNSSPRSSPNVQDNEFYIKKRHSLPGTNERQGSPRIRRTMSQGQQEVKGSETQSPQGILQPASVAPKL